MLLVVCIVVCWLLFGGMIWCGEMLFEVVWWEFVEEMWLEGFEFDYVV